EHTHTLTHTHTLNIHTLTQGTHTLNIHTLTQGTHTSKHTHTTLTDAHQVSRRWFHHTHTHTHTHAAATTAAILSLLALVAFFLSPFSASCFSPFFCLFICLGLKVACKAVGYSLLLPPPCNSMT